jgi:short-subunit dehydrogenase
MFAGQRARIGLLARGRDGLEAAAREVREAGGEAIVVPTDVSDFDQVEAAAARVEEVFGPIDVWVNNAMVTVFSRVRDIEAEEMKRVTDVTYLGTVWGTMVALKRMQARDAGTIVLVGSALAYRGIPLQGAYCGAKHAIQGFFESLRTELMNEGSNVKLTMVQLPGLNTPQFNWQRNKLDKRPQPVPPIFQPEVAAESIIWAASHPRREVHVGVPAVKTIWGNRLAPWFADRYLARKGVRSQQTEEDEDPNRPDNLFEPLPGDHGARGRFNDRSKDRSVQAWWTTHRAPMSAVIGVTALAVAVLIAGLAL